MNAKSKHQNTFSQARIKLTVFYIVICALLLFIFSLAAIGAERTAFSKIEQALADKNQRPKLTALLETRLANFDQNFRDRLVFFDVVLLAVASLASYFLSAQTLAPIQAMLEEQESFAADASHELRTPLTTMSMEIEALLRSEKEIPPIYKQVFMSIQEEIGRLTTIVTGLLTIVRTETTDHYKNNEIVNLYQIALESQKQMERLAHAKNIHMSLSGKTVKVLGNTEQLKEIILILLDNALKYTLAKGKVTIVISDTARQGIITVSDTGMGILDADLPHVFERFYRVSGVHRVTKGHGLGLSIAAKLVEANHGIIRVKSQIGQGSDFTVLLPRIS